MTEENIADSGQTASVAVAELSDSELDSFFEESKGFDQKAPEETPQPPAQKTQEEKKPEEPQKAEDPKPSEPKVEETPEQKLAKAEAEATRLKALHQQQELFIQRRNSEIGQLRKQLRETQEKLQAGLDEKFVESPTKALQDMEKLREIQQQLGEVDQEEETLNTRHYAQQVVLQHIDPTQVQIGDLVDVLKSDGLPQEAIDNFLADPFTAAPPDAIVLLSKRAMERRAFAEKEAAFQQLATMAKQLLEENESLKKKPQQAIKNVAQMLRSSPQVTASSGASSSTPNSLLKNPSLMSDAELNEFLKNA